MNPFAIRMIALAAGALVAALGGFTYWRSTQNPPAAVTAPEPAVAARPEAPAGPGVAAPSAPQTAALPPSSPQPPSAPTPAPSAPPQFDIVRVSPDGETLAAGRAPGATRVELLDGGKVIAADKVDQSGQFVLLPPALSSGDHLLTLRVTPEGQPATSSNQSVAVGVRPGTSPLVTLAEPGKPSVVLASPSPATPPSNPVATAAPAPKAQAAIRTAEVEAGGRFYATGTAPPGSTVRLYLNGSHVADAHTAGDGKWSLTITKGVSGGKYALRADVVDKNDKVVSRAEVPFEAPVAVAAAGPAAAAPAPPAVAGSSGAASQSGPGPAAQSPAAPAPAPPAPPAVAGASSAASQPSPGAAAQSPSAPAPASPAPPAVSGASSAASQPGPGPAAQLPAAPAPASPAPPAVAAAPGAASQPGPGSAAQSPGAPAPASPAQTAGAQPSEPAAASAPAHPAPPLIPAEPSSAAPQHVAAAGGNDATSNPVVPEISTATVVHGDSLWRISRVRWGKGKRYTVIYEANAAQIRNPDLIYPGQILVLPH